jgi:hypothetical protein
MDPINSPEHRIAMDARWLSESVNALSAAALRDETLPLVAAELPLLFTAYTKLAFLLSALSKKAA